MLKAICKFVLTDKITGKVREFEKPNYIDRTDLMGLFTSDSSGFKRVAIVGASNTNYPVCVDGQKAFYSSPTYSTGADSGGIGLVNYFPKVGAQSAYIQFYSVFQPQVADRIINAVGLVTGSSNNTTYSSFLDIKTCINLNPPCVQTTTEYLSIFYRVILVEDELDLSPYKFKERTMFSMSLDNATSRLRPFYLNSSEVTYSICGYPFRVSESFNNTAKVWSQEYRDLSWSGFGSSINPGSNDINISNSQLLILTPNKFNNNYFSKKIHLFPKIAPNQYTQSVGKFFKTIAR